MKSESGSLPRNNVKVNGCHDSTCMMFRLTDQSEYTPDIVVNRKFLFLPHLPGYIAHVVASFTLLALLYCSLVFMSSDTTPLSVEDTGFYISS